MNIWLLRIGEPLPVVVPDGRLMRMGMLAEELSNRGHHVTWFSSTFNHFTKEQLFKSDTMVKVKDNYYLDLSYANKYKKNISVSRIIHQMTIANKFKKKAEKLEKPDIIFVSYPTIEYAEKAVKYGNKYNVPVIVDIRDLWPDIFSSNLSRVRKIIAAPYIQLMQHKAKNIMKNAFAISAVTEAMLEWGLEKGQRKKSKYDRFFYIGYKKHDANKAIQNIDSMLDKSKFNISFFATINNQFNYKIINEISTELEKRDKDIFINICGDGPQMELLKNEIKDDSNVKLFGWTGKDELDYILRNTKIGLAPYKNIENFQMGITNKFAEYISYGLPIILTTDGYMKKLAEENQCGISSNDIKEVCDYIIKLKNNPEEYKKASQNAKKLYEKYFVADEIYKNLSKYLEQINDDIKNNTNK